MVAAMSVSNARTTFAYVPTASFNANISDTPTPAVCAAPLISPNSRSGTMRTPKANTASQFFAPYKGFWRASSSEIFCQLRAIRLSL